MKTESNIDPTVKDALNAALDFLTPRCGGRGWKSSKYWDGLNQCQSCGAERPEEIEVCPDCGGKNFKKVWR